MSHQVRFNPASPHSLSSIRGRPHRSLLAPFTVLDIHSESPRCQTAQVGNLVEVSEQYERLPVIK